MPSSLNKITRRLKPAATVVSSFQVAIIPLSGLRAFCFPLLTLLILCNGFAVFSPGFAQEIQTVDGVRTVHNTEPKWDDNSEISLEFVQKIGGIDETRENFIFYNLYDLTRDKKGNIFILDSGNKRIQKFSAIGEYRATYGGGGQGPGEFRLPMSIALDSKGNMYVRELDGNRLITLNPEGEELHRFNAIRSGNRVRLLTDDKLIIGDLGVAVHSSSAPVDKSWYPLFKVYDTNGTVITEFGSPMYVEEKAYERNSITMHNLTMDGGVTFDTDGNGSLYVAYKYENRIEKRDENGKIVLTFDRPLNYDITKYTFDNGRPVAPNLVSTGIGVDNKDRIWAHTFTKQPKDDPDVWERGTNLKNTKKDYSRFEVFDSTGYLLQYVSLPMDLYRMRLVGGRLYIIDVDRVSVYEYKIVEK